MRLWLDEMIPGEVARQLRRLGHDVQAVQEPQNRWAWGLDDAEQLEVAVRQGRALVTYNLRDFIPLSRTWVEESRTLLGIILVHPPMVPASDVGGLVKKLDALLRSHPEDEAFKDRVVFL